MSDASDGRAWVAGVQRSRGGVPKLPIDRARVDANGLDGDWQTNRKHHGGPDRALCLYSMELLEALAVEGHAASPGAMGENITIAGLDWKAMRPGACLRIGTVEVEITALAWPCKTIAGVFRDRDFTRVSDGVNSGWSRVYARVVGPGTVAVGDDVRLGAPS